MLRVFLCSQKDTFKRFPIPLSEFKNEKKSFENFFWLEMWETGNTL
jgi:hypothetical protein